MRITKNFNLAELTKTAQPYPNTPNAEQTVNLCRLAFYLLQPLRDLLGKPIDIICAFRSEKVNNAVGGTNKSQHLLGQAVDINVSGMAKFDLFKIIADKLNFDQLIYEIDSNCLHVSYNDEQVNRKEILIRKIVNGKKTYYPYTVEQLNKMTKP